MPELPTEPWTIARLLSWTTTYLGGHASESPRLDAEVLLAHALGCERIALYTRFDEVPGDAVRVAFRGLVQQRAQGAPVAYLVGHKEFFSLDFEVNRAVLIPRPDSEFVVLEFLRLAKPRDGVVGLDVGTGSGNLAVAAEHQLASARFFATDTSPEALAVARRNAERHGVADRIEFLRGHLFEPLAAGTQVDFVLSNPPYIPHDQIAQLPIGVRDHEPHAALDGGPTGLEVVGQIIAQAARYLRPGGQLILEIGAAQESAVRDMIAKRGEYELLPTIFDYAGHARVVSARRTGG